jgi:hypothetical protein
MIESRTRRKEVREMKKIVSISISTLVIGVIPLAMIFTVVLISVH